MPQFFENTKDGSASETSIWVEKYRPNTLEDYIGNDRIKNKVADWIEDDKIPHILFHGPAGTGKTTMAKIITDSISCDSMYINASDENSVDTIRENVKSFASSVAMNNLKVIVLDEFDYMSQSAQAALRNIMESFHDSTRFILTCNFKEKVIDAIDSRTQSFRVEPPSKSQVAKQLTRIFSKEDVKFSKKHVASLVDQYYPDIRKIINTAQLNTRNGELQLNEATIEEANFESKLVSLLQSDKSVNSKFKKIRKLVQNSDISQYERVFRQLYDKVDEYAEGNVADVMIAISEAQHRDALVVDKEINFMHLIIDIISTI